MRPAIRFHVSINLYCLDQLRQTNVSMEILYRTFIFLTTFNVSNHPWPSYGLTLQHKIHQTRSFTEKKTQNDTLKAFMHHLTAILHAVSFLIAFCLHNSGQEKENRIWSSFIWNSLLFPAWGMCQRIGVWHKTIALGNLGRNQRAIMSQTDLG